MFYWGALDDRETKLSIRAMLAAYYCVGTWKGAEKCGVTYRIMKQAENSFPTRKDEIFALHQVANEVFGTSGKYLKKALELFLIKALDINRDCQDYGLEELN